MLVINKQQPTTRFIVTVSELAPSAPVLKLYITSRYTNKTYNYTVGSNHSTHPERYDEYQFNTSVFADLEPGKHSYFFYDEGRAKAVEQGVLMVIDAMQTKAEKVAEEFTTVTPGPAEDDFVVYNPEA